MKVTVERDFSSYTPEPEALFKVRIQQGVQRFYLGYKGLKEEVDWMAKMFRKALRNHDKERDGKRSKSRDSAQERIRDKAKRR